MGEVEHSMGKTFIGLVNGVYDAWQKQTFQRDQSAQAFRDHLVDVIKRQTSL